VIRITGVVSLLMLIGSLSGCTASMHKQIAIEAPAERVWSVLTEFQSYPKWNPFFTQVKGELRVGSDLEVTMQPVGKDQQEFSPTVLEVSPGRKLQWRGRLLLPWVFDGTHSFEIRPVDADTVVFIQYEDFGGMLVPFAGFEPYEAGWEKMNRALKARAEAELTARVELPGVHFVRNSHAWSPITTLTPDHFRSAAPVFR